SPEAPTATRMGQDVVAEFPGCRSVEQSKDCGGDPKMKTGTLQVSAEGDREILMEREFDAPRDHLFDAWTKQEFLKRWMLGPDGWSLAVCDVDLSVGGAYRYLWCHADGREMGSRGVYREVTPPERLVFTESFDDTWYPGESVLTTVFTEKAGKTTLTTRIRYVSQAARDTVLKSNMEKGVAASYDRLAGLVES